MKMRKGKTMKTKDFLKKHNACIDGAKWALSISKDMGDVWDAMIEQGKHEWLRWTATRPGVFPDAVLRKLACRFVRETPIADGRKVWDLLTDERSRNAVEVAERYADGKATDGELQAAEAAAYAAARAACAAARASCAVAYAAAYAASDDASEAAYDAYAAAEAAGDAAKVAQAQMIAELGNPFKQDNPIPYI
jgi:quinol monooxygenase YgiN